MNTNSNIFPQKSNFISILRLMRFHKPVGTLLLFLPTAWALWIANNGVINTNIFILFLLGTIIMRSAGCVINDLADQKFDGLVARTKDRPLVSGELSKNTAFIITFLLLLSALIIVIKLPLQCFYYALAALFVTIIYPFCKRFLYAPQLILGVAFSFGIPMVFAALNIHFGIKGWLLLFINYIWIVCYDTIYALSDIKDDIKIGVNSSAILFGKNVFLIIAILNTLMHALWLTLGLIANFSFMFFLSWLFAGVVLMYQQKIVKDGKSILAFNISVFYGALLLIGIIFG